MIYNQWSSSPTALQPHWSRIQVLAKVSGKATEDDWPPLLARPDCGKASWRGTLQTSGGWPSGLHPFSVANVKNSWNSCPSKYIDFIPFSVLPSMHFKHQEYMNVLCSLFSLSLHLLDGNTAPKWLDTDSEKGLKKRKSKWKKNPK